MSHSLNSPFYPHIDARKFTAVVKKLRQFFDEKGMLEVHTQNRLSILAACEDPFNIRKFEYVDKVWPLPQTGQMWLEHELLTHPDEVGYYCLSTSYRNEANPIEGRHCMIFPMFEFEFKGSFLDLATVEHELLDFLGFNSIAYKTYEDMCFEYGVGIIDNETEGKMYSDIADAVLLTMFPERTNPFWNMKRGEDGYAKKIDVIMCGQETIGSAERSCDVNEMKTSFFEIEGGKYSDKLFEMFGYGRVIEELDEFLSYNFFPRVGGGIGVTRLIRAMEINKLI